MRAADIVIGGHVQLGDGPHWTDNPRRARIVQFAKRHAGDTQRKVRIEWLTEQGDPDPDPVGSTWWQPAELVEWGPWYEGYQVRQAERDVRTQLLVDLRAELDRLGLGMLVFDGWRRRKEGMQLELLVGPDEALVSLLTDRLRRIGPL